MFDSVADGGVLVFTTQGRKNLQYFPTAKINEGGYWFLADSEQKDLNTSEYGQMIIMEDRARREIFSVLHKQPEIYQEGFWWSHQDLYVIRKD